MRRERHTCPRRMQEVEPIDRWSKRNGELACSFCGSMHPDRFMELVEAGFQVVPTDKNYKAYLTDPAGKTLSVKFYYQHLDEAQRLRFIELVNNARMHIAEPGHFYVLPFFCRTNSVG